MPSERKAIAVEANLFRDRLLKAVKYVEGGAEDKQQCERQAQSLNTFSNLMTRDR